MLYPGRFILIESVSEAESMAILTTLPHLFSDACNPLVYRVLDDHRRSVSYRPSNKGHNNIQRSSLEGASNSAAQISRANRYDLVTAETDPDEDSYFHDHGW